MSPENTQKLFEAFPRLYRGRNKPVRESSMSCGFECGDGWIDLLWKLSQSIEGEARKLGLDAQSESWPEVSQVKQKAGSLRFYLEHATPAMEALIEETDKVSRQTCEVCGSLEGQPFHGLRSSKVLCDDHAGLAPNNNLKR